MQLSLTIMMGYIKAQSLVFLQKKKIQMQVEIANFVCSIEEKKVSRCSFLRLFARMKSGNAFNSF